MAQTNSMNFFQWSSFWQSAPAFPYSPAGFGVAGSIDAPLSAKVIAASGGDGSQLRSADQWLSYYRSVVPDPWQQATTALVAVAGTDRLTFFQWAWCWQRAARFPNSPLGFGVMGSIDDVLIQNIIALGGGDGSQIVSADQWVADYRAFAPDPWQQASSAMTAEAGTNLLSLWQWAWYWQRTPVFSNAPAGFGVQGSIDNVSGLMEKIVAADADDGYYPVTADQWVNYYRAVADSWQQAAAIVTATAGVDKLSFWQWVYYWQRASAFAYAPPGFGVLGSIDSIPGLVDNIIAASGHDGADTLSAQQWTNAYRLVWSSSQ
jgi:hypothetical protein